MESTPAILIAQQQTPWWLLPVNRLEPHQPCRGSSLISPAISIGCWIATLEIHAKGSLMEIVTELPLAPHVEIRFASQINQNELSVRAGSHDCPGSLEMRWHTGSRNEME